MKMNRGVREFYDEHGWQTRHGVHVDRDLFVDQRPEAADYYQDAEYRAQEHIIPGGRAFLDVGCGANPRTEYSNGYDVHICCDFSVVGLQEARTKAPEGMAFVLADACSLPFASQAVDACVSAHVIYHIPGLENQKRAFQEFHCILAAGRTAVVIQTNPLAKYFDPGYGLVGLAVNYLRLAQRLAKRLMGRPTEHMYWSKIDGKQLYHRSMPAWQIRNALPECDVDVLCFRLLSPHFTKRYAVGARFLRMISNLERRMPHLLSLLASYVMIVIRQREESRCTSEVRSRQLP